MYFMAVENVVDVIEPFVLFHGSAVLYSFYFIQVVNLHVGSGWFAGCNQKGFNGGTDSVLFIYYAVSHGNVSNDLHEQIKRSGHGVYDANGNLVFAGNWFNVNRVLVCIKPLIREQLLVVHVYVRGCFRGVNSLHVSFNDINHL